MTQEQKQIMQGFKKYIDQIDRTSTLSMSQEDFAAMQEISINIGRGRIESCKTCIINALRQLYHESIN